MVEDNDKKYFWLQLHDDFFSSKRIKKLRKLSADFLIIYLKLQLLSLKNNGVLIFSGIENTFAEELSLEIDEDADKIQVTLAYLQSCNLLIPQDQNEFFLPYVEKCTGSVKNDAHTRELTRLRVQKYREKQKALTDTELQERYSNVTCNTEIEIEKDIEKEKEIEIEKDLERELEKKVKEKEKKSSRFSPPTIDEIKDYCCEKNYPVKVAEPFYYYYDSIGWVVGKRKMTNWHAALAGWVNREKEFRKEKVDSVSKVESFV